MAVKDDVPKVQILIPAMHKALLNSGGSGTLHELNEEVARILTLPEEIQELTKGDSTDTWFGYRCRWARTYLKLRGFADNSERGIWTITSSGMKATQQEVDRVYKDAKKVQKQSPETDPTVDEEEIELRSEISWEDRLLSVLKHIPPDSFERLCQRVLRESGFSKVEVTGRSGDGGIDGTGVLRINLISFQTLFQCKRYADAVGSSVVRDFRGAMIGRADKGLIITTGRFTAEAQREATRDGAPAIELIDGIEL